MKAIILGGGLCCADLSKYINPGDFIVCADSGYDHALRLGCKPDLVIGDMDSITTEIEHGIEIIKAPVQKDETDSMLCIDVLFEKGFKEILFFGALGGRFDHSFANITLLLYAAKKGINLKIIHENSVMFVIDKETTISGEKGDLVSLFPIGGDCRKITTTGLFYPLSDETLFCDNPRGVSNSLIENSAVITVNEGFLLVIHTKIGGEKHELC